MRIMLAGPSPWIQTGYGTQTASLLERLVGTEHELALLSLFGHEGAVGLRTIAQSRDGPSKEIRVYSKGRDLVANDVVAQYAQDFDADIVITLLNTWLMPGYTDVIMRWIPIVPFEGDPLDKYSKKYLKSAFRVIALSEYGRYWIEEDAEIPCIVIPHGIESGFQPNPEAAEAFREGHGIPEGARLIGMVGVNRYFPCRKGYDQAFEAFSRILKEHDDVYLYVHANPTAWDGASDLIELAKFFGIQERLRLPVKDRYIGGYNRNDMAGMYTAFDCLIQSTHGEGFGLPVVEAQACGTPIVATACTTMPELVCPDAGKLVKWAARYVRPGGFWNYIPDVQELAEGMRWGLEVGRDPKVRSACTEWAEQWRWDKVWKEKWVPFLAEVEEEVREDTWRDRKFERILNLGCGSNPKKGAVNHDIKLHSPYVNVAWDLNETPWPWEDNSFDMVIAQDVLEHLKPELVEVMNELWRILAPGGLLHVRSPLVDSDLAHIDPTHLRAFTMSSFDYFDPRTPWGEKYEFYSEYPWRLRHRKTERGNLVVELTPDKGGVDPGVQTQSDAQVGIS